MKTIPTDLIAPLFDPATFAERGKADALLTEIRRDYPLARAEVPGYDPHWIVSRHADIQEVSRQNDLFHNADRSATVIPQMGEALVQAFTGGDFNLFRSLVQLDGEDHKRHRRVLFQALGSQSVARPFSLVEPRLVACRTFASDGVQFASLRCAKASASDRTSVSGPLPCSERRRSGSSGPSQSSLLPEDLCRKTKIRIKAVLLLTN